MISRANVSKLTFSIGTTWNGLVEVEISIRNESTIGGKSA